MITEETKRVARRWVVALSDDASPETRVRFERWLGQDPSHAAAYRDSLHVWNAVGEMRHLASLSLPETGPWWTLASLRGALEATGAAFRHPRLAFAVFGVVIVLGVSLFSADGLSWLSRERGVYATTVAEIRDVTLPDGSTVTLGARSTIQSQLSEVERRVLLKDGAAVFNVASDPQRPFVVATEGILIRALGTQFEVYSDAGQVRVSVLEGVVEVAAAATEAPIGEGVTTLKPVRLTAGLQITTSPHGERKKVRRVNASEAAPWRNGMLRYTDASLTEVIADSNRYYAGRIELGDAQLGRLRVTTAFGTDQIEQLLDSLPGALPVRLERIAPGHVVLLPASESTTEGIR